MEEGIKGRDRQELFALAIRSVYDPVKYKQYKAELEELRTKLKDKRDKARLRALDARKLFAHARYEEFLEEARKLINILKAYKADSYLGHMYLLSGICYNIYGDFRKAVEFELLAEKIFRAEADQSALIMTRLSQANVIRDRGLLMQALDLYLVCAAECDPEQEFSTYVMTQFELMHIYHEVRQYDHAQQCLQNIAAQLADPRMRLPFALNYHHRHAELLLKREKPGEALQALAELDLVRGDFKNDYLQVGIEQNAGIAHNLLGNFDKTIAHFEEAAACAERVNALPNIGKIYNSLAEAYINNGKTEQAVRALAKAQKAAEDCQSKTVLANVFRIRELLANQNGDTVAAYDAFKKQHQLEKEIYEQDFKMKIEALNSLSELKHTTRSLEETISELNIKRQELQSASIFLEKKDNLIERLDQFILSLKAEQQERGVTLDMLHKKIQEAKQLDFQQEQLKITLDDQSHRFIIELRTKFPKITLTEARICYMITRGLSSKEIADILICSLKNVEQHRYRARKKLAIPKGQSFSGFLMDALAS